MEGSWDHEFRIKNATWKDDRVVVACSNEKTAEIFKKMIKEINIDGQKFRAWPANEFSHFITLILPPGSEVFQDNIWPLFLAMNGIDGHGKHGTPRMAHINKGTKRLIVAVSEVLASKIRSLGGKGALGGYEVTFNVSK